MPPRRAARRVVDALRLVGEIAAGHHDGPIEPRSSQMCSGVVGSMKPSVPSPGATAAARRSGTVRAHQHDHDGCARRCQCLGFVRRCTTGARRRISRAISANGFASRRLALAQPRHGFRIGRVAGELIAAEPLDRDDLALLNSCRRLARRRAWNAGRSSPAAVERTSRARGPHAWHAIGLRMEAAVAGSSYSARQAAQTVNGRHRGGTAVVGNACDDATAEARNGCSW